MSDVTVDFVERLVSTYPRLKQVLDEHISDNFGEVLPHLLFGDLTRYVVSRFIESKAELTRKGGPAEQEVRRLLGDLEDAYADGDEEVQELISVSLLENLPRPGQKASEIRTWLGPELSAQLRVIG